MPGSVQQGMSGSPIVDESGAVIGLISTIIGLDDTWSLNPHLAERLPTWLLRLLRGEKRWLAPPAGPGAPASRN